MSIRHNILAAISQDGATMDDICDRLNQPRKKLHDNVKSCVTDGLAIRGRDDITGLPFYTLTAAGRARLAEGPGVGGRKPSMTTQPAVAKNTGSRESVPPVGQVSPPAEVAATETTTPGAGHDAPAVSDELKFALGMIRKALCIDHDDSIGIVPTIEALIESNNELRKLATEAQTEADRLYDYIIDMERGCGGSGDATDMVNHPPHYQGKVECIDAIESALGPEGFAAYCRGNAIKYAFRAGKKGDAAQDLAKAQWYLARVAA